MTQLLRDTRGNPVQNLPLSSDTSSKKLAFLYAKHGEFRGLFKACFLGTRKNGWDWKTIVSFWVFDIYFQGRSVKPPGGKDFLFVMFEETPEVILFDFPAKNMFAMEKGEGNKLHEMVS